MDPQQILKSSLDDIVFEGRNKAYGAYDPSLVQTLNRSDIAIENPVSGNLYSIRRLSDNAVAYVKIVNVTSDTITIDQNHDLAGKDLVFTITLVDIARK